MPRKKKVGENQLQLGNGSVITLNSDQITGIDKINTWLKSNDSFFTLSGYAGTGKEQPVDCKVYTPRGRINIGEIEIGDKIFGSKGDINTVAGVYPQGVKQSYRVEFSDGTHTECGIEHLWNVYVNGSQNQETKGLEEIVGGGLLGDDGYPKYSIPNPSPLPYDEVELPIHPYLFGMFLHYEEMDPYGMWHQSYSNSIPRDYLHSSVDQRWDLLRGLMDTNAMFIDDRVKYHTQYYQFAECIAELVRSLGGVSTIEKIEETMYAVDVVMPESPFNLVNKTNHWEKYSNKKAVRYIVSVVPSRICEQVCIMVDSKDGLYITDNHIVTHNTTIVKKVIDDYNLSVVMSAPTHKAKKVLSYSTNMTAQTLPSLLGLRPDVDLDSFNPNRPEFNPIAEPKIGEYDLVVIDESSMINQDLFNLIKEKLSNTTTKVLFMGDPAQIPPIGEKESVVFFQDDIQKHELTKIERQNMGNPLSIVYTNLRNNLLLSDGGYERKTMVNNLGEGVVFLDSKEEFRNAVLSKFTSTDFKKDGDFAKVIAWRNKTVMGSNRVIRNEIFGRDACIIETGDVLTAYRSIQGHRGNYNIIENSADYRVISRLEMEKNMYGIWGYRVKIKENTPLRKTKTREVFIIDATDHDNLHKYAEEHDKYREYGMRNRLIGGWFDYYEFRRHNILMKTIDSHRDGNRRNPRDVIVKDMDYGYAITCHKVQGSTYTHVFIMENDIDINRSVKERNQLKYTSFTRPRISATVLFDI